MKKYTFSSRAAKLEGHKPFRISAFFLILFSILFWEILLHVSLCGEINTRILYVILFSAFFALSFTVFTGLLPPLGNKILLWLVMVVLYLWYAAQLIYFKIFGGFISVYLIQMGGEAITAFFKETVSCVVDNLWFLGILAIPLILTGILMGLRRLNMERRHILRQAILVVLCIALHVVALSTLPLGGTGAYTIYDVYHNVNTGTDSSVASLGFLTTFRLELK